jgi:hypothetical protein
MNTTEPLIYGIWDGPMLSYRRLDDGALCCAACGCREEYDPETGQGHCPYGHECLTGVGTDAECPCAKFLPAMPTCPHCGHRFPSKWQAQNHLLPSPTCLGSAFGAAGRFAAKPSFEPPLLAAMAGKGR